MHSLTAARGRDKVAYTRKYPTIESPNNREKVWTGGLTSGGRQLVLCSLQWPPEVQKTGRKLLPAVLLHDSRWWASGGSPEVGIKRLEGGGGGALFPAGSCRLKEGGCRPMDPTKNPR